MPITYLKGDATKPQGDGRKIIAHICNDAGGWGAGFVLALSRRWRIPEAAYRNWAKYNQSQSVFSLGNIQIVDVNADLKVANMIAQKGYCSPSNPIPLQYDHLKTCLTTLFKWASEDGSSIHMPRIGCGLAGGTWQKVEAVIATVLLDFEVPVFVYDLK